MAEQAKVVVVARHEGRCSHCDGIIEPGQRIEKSTAGWMHEGCPADPPDPPESHYDGDH